MLFLGLQFIAFPEKKNALLLNNKYVETQASGSIGLYYEGKCHQTFPNQTLQVNEKMDWCSNVATSKDDKPWISFNIGKEKSMKLSGYSVRCGCCWYDCCCIDDGAEVKDVRYCCCRLYSFSLQGSNDNKTWKTIHSIVKDKSIYYCKAVTYEFPVTEAFRYVRFILDEEFPGCQRCMQINQIELYGEAISSPFSDSFDGDDNDESVSIIGKINKNSQE